MKSTFALVSALWMLTHKARTFSSKAHSNVAVYWGQGEKQKSLESYCDSKSLDIVLLSFLNNFPEWTLNLADECSARPGEMCPQSIERGIEYCQQKGKIVMLSLGGEDGDYGFNNDTQAASFATTLWNVFGGGWDPYIVRPFGKAIVDGFDLDIENQNSKGYAALVDSLRVKYGSDPNRKYYISAAPQCLYPDESVGPVMERTPLDFAFIQFYNNDCSLNGDLFNWNQWENYARNISPNKDIRLYVGLPASPSSAGTGYVSAKDVKAKLSLQILNSPHFGGISLWDMEAAFTNAESGKKFVERMKSLVKTSGATLHSNANHAVWLAWASFLISIILF